MPRHAPTPPLTPEQRTFAAGHVRLVWSIARRLHDISPTVRQLGSIEDAVQAGCLGLLAAVRGYRPETGYAFSTYAHPIIYRRILDHGRVAGLIRVPRCTARQAERGHDSRMARQAQTAGRCRQLPRDFDRAAPEEEAVDTEGLAQALGRLPVRLRAVVVGYYGLGGGQRRTCAELGRAVGVTTHHVTNLLGAARRRLRVEMDHA